MVVVLFLSMTIPKVKKLSAGIDELGPSPACYAVQVPADA
jgi:hypothetical protein